MVTKFLNESFSSEGCQCDFGILDVDRNSLLSSKAGVPWWPNKNFFLIWSIFSFLLGYVLKFKYVVDFILKFFFLFCFSFNLCFYFLMNFRKFSVSDSIRKVISLSEMLSIFLTTSHIDIVVYFHLKRLIFFSYFHAKLLQIAIIL